MLRSASVFPSEAQGCGRASWKRLWRIRLARTIQIAASLPASPDRLFDTYLDPVEHAAFTGSPVTVSDRPGAAFSAFNDVITGTILQVVPKRLIVRSWRSPYWGTDDLDSTLILTFLPEQDGGRIELTQVNVVETDFAGVSHGWEKFYWTPWSSHLGGG
jgi:uncharacterized protein YndB with AHSA1/START domain